jgi:hypothetical protein
MDESEVLFLEFTPTSVKGIAVTFHLRWTRVDGGNEAAPVDLDVTLRPGESIPIDSLRLTPVPSDPPACRATAMTVRIKGDYWPPSERESRLIAPISGWWRNRPTGPSVRSS